MTARSQAFLPSYRDRGASGRPRSTQRRSADILRTGSSGDPEFDVNCQAPRREPKSFPDHGDCRCRELMIIPGLALKTKDARLFEQPASRVISSFFVCRARPATALFRDDASDF